MSRGFHRYRIILLKVLIPVLSLSGFHIPAKGQYDENLLKAVYIERITRFIDWPENHQTADVTSFTIGVFGDEEFYKTITKVFATQQVKNRKTAVLLLTEPGQVRQCDLCYIGTGSESVLKEIMEKAASFGVLVFSQSKKAEKTGVHINFFLESDKLKFELNKKNLDSSKFRVSSLLLSNAKVN